MLNYLKYLFFVYFSLWFILAYWLNVHKSIMRSVDGSLLRIINDAG